MMTSRQRSMVGAMVLVVGLLTGRCTVAEDGKAQNASNPVVLIATSMGDMKVELYRDKAPITVANFLSYVADKHYDGTIFHRVIPRFMIQGGGMSAEMKEKATKPPIKNEAGNGLRNEIGTLAMARTPAVDSASAQFFINVANNGFLDHKDETMSGFGYAVFGKVIDGMKVAKQIEGVPTTSKGGHDDVPQTAVVIKSISVVSPGAAPAKK